MVRYVEAGLSNAAAARQFNTTPKTVAKWVERFRAGGVDGLRDRSSRPLSLPSQTAPATCAVVEALRVIRGHPRPWNVRGILKMKKEIRIREQNHPMVRSGVPRPVWRGEG